MSEAKKPPPLRLAKLPDRKPVKIVITLSAELSAKLQAYVEAYRMAYGEAEDAATLVPYIVEAFVDRDLRRPRLRSGARRSRSS